MNYNELHNTLLDLRKQVDSTIHQIQVAKMKDPAVTLHTAIARYFKLNGNKPVHYKVLAAVIGRKPGSVAAVLSAYPQFRNTKFYSGRWKMYAKSFKNV